MVIDDFLPLETAEAVREEFDRTGDGWKHYSHYNERKLALTDVSLMLPATRALFDALQSERFVRIVEKLTGIENLLADPDLDGAGLHRCYPGGFLNLHTDFLSHTKNRHWSRQLKLLLYLNREWPEEWNGALELWDADLKGCVRKIAPVFNRCMIFHTCEGSYTATRRPSPVQKESRAARSRSATSATRARRGSSSPPTTARDPTTPSTRSCWSPPTVGCFGRTRC